MIRFRYPSSDALRTGLEQLLEGSSPGDGETPIPVDVYKVGSEIVVEAELPGVQLSDIELSGEDGVLTIRAHGKSAQREYAIRERPFGDQSRLVRLPDDCDLPQARASLQDGVLRITVPRPKPAVSHSIKVEIATDVSRPSTIVLEKGPQVVDAVKGKDYREVDPGSRARRKRSR